MEKTTETAASGSRYSNVTKSFNGCLRFLLTEFSFEDFSRAFPKFSGAEQDQLYQLYVQVITSLHETLQDDFRSICLETQVGTILDTVEHHVEQRSLDPLCSQKTNLGHVKHDLLAMEQDEIQSLEQLLNKVEDEKHSIKAQCKLLKKKHEDSSVAPVAMKEIDSLITKYGSHSDEVFEHL
ncbi:uncharacterized protein LOC130816071 isoform X1 [Amaranthus tricolor]|uniref:uncharacterized protein LOC130816071 isoform X1 n=1 Tax=Amaranthus tricolor TaxID=29722 RepID=UPI002590CD29|nr:uncharacterized protein LOC130816071 isoform X1 [Amaranthus tricolor]XP_057538635.1 uncharacterized protein LOC130816071 isoform X1 [Amaranthus tricolor]